MVQKPIPFYPWICRNRGSELFQWEVLDDFPGQARIQPVVVAQNSAEEMRLYLVSGSSFPEQADEALISTDGLEYSPKTGRWRPIAEILMEGHAPFSLHGADGIPLGMNHILFVGGVNRATFKKAWENERLGNMAIQSRDTAGINVYTRWKKSYLSHEPEWYKFNKEVLIYHTITNTWSVGADYPYPAPAGAKLTPWKEGWMIISGEIMPGIRSPKVYHGELKPEPAFGLSELDPADQLPGRNAGPGLFLYEEGKGHR